jgi:hypothetical protein
MPASPAKKGNKKKSAKNPDKIIIGVNIQKTELAKIKLLARGWDRSVSWVIRELIDASMFQHEQEVEDFKEQFAEDAVSTPSIASTSSIPQEAVVDTPPTHQDAATNTSPKQPIYFPPRNEDAVDESAEVTNDAA